MRNNLTARVDNFAVYLPAVQRVSAEKLTDAKQLLREKHVTPNITAGELNWLLENNKHWEYKWCLASAGHLYNRTEDNIITTRFPHSIVVGDSSGYQIGTGKLKATKEWKVFSTDVAKVKDEWLKSGIRLEILEWLDVNCNYAMTLDMPLWVADKNLGGDSPFHHFSTDELTELSVDNLRFFDSNRDRYTGCNFQNVLQAFGGSEPSTQYANSLASEEHWYNAVKDFSFEGWALGGDVGWRGGIYRVLRRLLILRDEGYLAEPRNWCHVLGVSQVGWAVMLTAIQRAIRAHVNEQFTVSYDSASPYMVAGRFQQYAVKPNLTTKVEDWIIRHVNLPTGTGIANHAQIIPFPHYSPIASMFTLQDLNIDKHPMAKKTTDALADEVLINHNVYVYVSTFIEANELVFNQSQQAPSDFVRAAAIIDKLFEVDDWEPLLDSNKQYLQSILERTPTSDYDFDDE